MMMIIDDDKLMRDGVYLLQDSISHRNLSPVALKNATQLVCAYVYGECAHEPVCVTEGRWVECVT